MPTRKIGTYQDGTSQILPAMQIVTLNNGKLLEDLFTDLDSVNSNNVYREIDNNGVIIKELTLRPQYYSQRREINGAKIMLTAINKAVYFVQTPFGGGGGGGPETDPIFLAQKGSANGVATLVSGKIPLVQLPNANLDFSASKAYILGDIVAQNDKIYRANGAIAAAAFNVANWTEISPSVGGGSANPEIRIITVLSGIQTNAALNAIITPANYAGTVSLINNATGEVYRRIEGQAQWDRIEKIPPTTAGKTYVDNHFGFAQNIAIAGDNFSTNENGGVVILHSRTPTTNPTFDKATLYIANGNFPASITNVKVVMRVLATNVISTLAEFNVPANQGVNTATITNITAPVSIPNVDVQIYLVLSQAVPAADFTINTTIANN